MFCAPSCMVRASVCRGVCSHPFRLCARVLCSSPCFASLHPQCRQWYCAVHQAGGLGKLESFFIQRPHSNTGNYVSPLRFGFAHHAYYPGTTDRELRYHSGRISSAAVSWTRSAWISTILMSSLSSSTTTGLYPSRGYGYLPSREEPPSWTDSISAESSSTASSWQQRHWGGRVCSEILPGNSFCSWEPSQAPTRK